MSQLPVEKENFTVLLRKNVSMDERHVIPLSVTIMVPVKVMKVVSVVTV